VRAAREAGGGDRGPMALEERPRILVARFAAPHRILSWAIARGGRASGNAVAFVQVDDAELAPPADARAVLLSRLAAAGVPDAVGLLTSRDVSARVLAGAAAAGVEASCLATVGLGNALRAGDPAVGAHPGTINLLCQVSAPLAEEALVEALAIAVEARTAAVLEAGVRSVATGAPATGTGTDCVVIAAPEGAPALPYAGKHTAAGQAVGAAVLAAVARGVREWREWQAARGPEEER
jgi:adenosylcobinamide amidohydrolase